MPSRPHLRARARLVSLCAALLARALHAAGPRAYAHVLDTLWEQQERARDARPSGLTLECPASVEPDPGERALVERLFRAYASAKRAERSAPAEFAPSSGWSDLIRSGYGPLMEALEHGDVRLFHRYLANFAGWEHATGIEESSRLRRIAREPHRKRHHERRVMAPLIEWWLVNEAQGRDLSDVGQPNAGNPCGVRAGNELVSRLSVWADVHAGLLARFLGRPGAVVAELGCGAGRLALALVRRASPACVIGLDLPEPLCCASYVLMREFPGARVLLHGEEPLQPDTFARHTFVMLPAHEIVHLPDDSIDLFVNENGLGDMTPVAARAYLHEICRSSRAFWHKNREHERWTFADGTRSLLAGEYPLPAERFTCLARYPDLSQSLALPWPRRERDLYWYLYARRG